ncbi:hypothetical protein AC731_012885 [Thauera humireducens]|uniref:ABC transporter permease n=2 Tax=Thauera humireducens TaxID=1134435 RepID=A0A127KB46_9RHOO|nr:hypothetical protein AC731_012885 [Thauera humireducens]
MSIGLFAATILSAQFSGRQACSVALDTGLSVIRLVLPLFGVLLLQELLAREFDRKLYLTSLTYPRPRHQFLLGRIGALVVFLLSLLMLLAGLLAAVTAWIGHSYTQATPPGLGLPYVVTIAFIALDLLVVLAIGTLIAVTTTTPSFVLIGTLGFMLVARSYSAIVALLTRDTTLVGNSDTYQSSLSLLGYLLPDLAALDVRMISLYGQWQFLPDDWPLRVVSTLAYAAALFALSVWALNRKKFS